uniref:Uncharacterized protein n=1 Tax=Cucumis sativus TaxID=3659 RepID=A0A0A0K6N7_CUCSA
MAIVLNYPLFQVYGLSWVVIISILLLMKAVSVGRRKFSASFQLLFRLAEGFIFIICVAGFITLVAIPHMTIRDIILCILAFLPTGWGLLLLRNRDGVASVHTYSISGLVSICFRVPNTNVVQSSIQQRAASFKICSVFGTEMFSDCDSNFWSESENLEDEED